MGEVYQRENPEDAVADGILYPGRSFIMKTSPATPNPANPRASFKA